MNLTIGIFAIPKNKNDLSASTERRASGAQRVLYNLIYRTEIGSYDARS